MRCSLSGGGPSGPLQPVYRSLFALNPLGAGHPEPQAPATPWPQKLLQTHIQGEFRGNQSSPATRDCKPPPPPPSPSLSSCRSPRGLAIMEPQAGAQCGPQELNQRREDKSGQPTHLPGEGGLARQPEGKLLGFLLNP